MNPMGLTDTGESNVVALLQQWAGRCPDRLCLAPPGDRAAGLTFAGLWQRVDAFAAAARARGITAGDRVVCMVPMSTGLYVVLLGLLKAGAVAVFVDPWIGRRQIAAFAARAAPRGYVGTGKSHLLRLFEPTLRGLPFTVTTGPAILGLPARTSLAAMIRHPGEGDIFPAGPEDPALITFTSGSSGTPKGANRTHGFLLAQHAALSAEFAYGETDVDMPMFPVFALHNIALGMTSVIPDMDFRAPAGVDGVRLLAQMRARHVTTCTASPPFVDRLCDALAAGAAARPPALRRLLTGGAPVTDAQLRRWQALLPEVEIVVVYGSTEAEPVAHLDAAERLRLHAEASDPCPGYCVGVPTPRLETRVIPICRGAVAALQSLPPGEIGELVVAGAHVCRAYVGDEAATAANKIAADGRLWHRMGDTGYFDVAGRFWVVGRVHSTIWRAGCAVHAQRVEQLASGLPLRQVAAVGLPDGALGERVVLVVVVPEGVACDEAVLRQRAAAAGIPLDDILVRRKPLPVDPRHNAKVDYVRLGRDLSGERVSRSGAV